MSEPKNIKICKEFKKLVGILAEKLEVEADISLDVRSIIETSGCSEGLWLEKPEIDAAVAFSTTYSINPAMCCVVMELANLIKDDYDRENVGERILR